jgi:hypothetical protein
LATPPFSRKNYLFIPNFMPKPNKKPS